ncbi:protein translocase subunit secF [Austwickia chelonae]|uniref:Protein-export membrane protein SecF n=1 Tax=Austwickia chelonae NBRC 105200 TaxID=1184607 RepID=K6W6R0_9MICO|nr:protein translocase subunit SecF [Austwickia chelonae]GAB77497.1 protein-export membrane protein SecF [Austwickia chelonae NBRC 105200]SEW11576.1 protein translocase subunit secF [Austwickia chelonae]
MNIATFGNDLYTGKRSIDFIGRRRTWYMVSVVLFVIAMLGLGVRQLNLGIEFTGGSDFRVTKVNNFDGFEQRARSVISSSAQVEGAKVTKVGGSDVRVETERFDSDKAKTVSDALAKEFGVPSENVTTSVIGPSWGASVSKQALQALAWFLLLVSVVLAIYFRTWKMSVAALVALFHDIFITVGIYALAGFEVTPASMIGFLTILGYSLYDTVVVFDKVRENTDEAISNGRKSFAEAANLAINQTLVRSINTTVVALLPVAAILLMGLAVIGPGTLTDLSLALFVGIAVGAYSSIFIATPLYAHLRDGEPEMQKLARQAERHQEKEAARARKAGVSDLHEDGELAQAERAGLRTQEVRTSSFAAADEESDGERTATGRIIHPSLQNGPRNQPRRLPRSKR